MGHSIPALSIRQPWAAAIINMGKDIENRNWPTRFRGQFLIHAAKAWGQNERDDVETVEDISGQSLEGRPLLGGIIGMAEIVDCVSQSNSPWFFGRYGFVIRNPRSLPFRSCRGQLGFFYPEFDQGAIA